MFKVKNFFIVSFSLCFALFSINAEAKKTEESNQLLHSYTESYLKDNVPKEFKVYELPDYHLVKDNRPIVCKMYNPLTLSEVEELSNTIIKATFLDIVAQKESLDPSEARSHNFTHSQIRVDEVYQGDVKPGDILELFEPFYIKEVGEEMYIKHYESYYPCKPGRSYIMFLVETSNEGSLDPGFGLPPEQERYTYSWYERGRFPIIDINSQTDISTMNSQDMDLCSQGGYKIYKDIYQEVIDKYLK